MSILNFACVPASQGNQYHRARGLLGGASLALLLSVAGGAFAQDATTTSGDAAAESGSGSSAQVEASETAGSADGLGTAEQVDRGHAAYDQSCSTCHGDDIIEEIAGYPNAGLFYNFISTAMPASSPGSLDPQTYADIIVYLLNENGFPEGVEELPADRDVLGEIDPGAAPAADGGEDEESDDAATGDESESTDGDSAKDD